MKTIDGITPSRAQLQSGLLNNFTNPAPEDVQGLDSMNSSYGKGKLCKSVNKFTLLSDFKEFHSMGICIG